MRAALKALSRPDRNAYPVDLVRISFRKRVTGWAILVVALLIAFAPGAGTVLCFEPDGTIALEDVRGGGPCTGVDGEHDDGPHLDSPVRSCCACLDVPIGNPAHEFQARCTVELRFELPPVCAPRLAPVVFVAWVPAHGGERIGPAGPPGPPGSSAHLRAFVLRV